MTAETIAKARQNEQQRGRGRGVAAVARYVVTGAIRHAVSGREIDFLWAARDAAIACSIALQFSADVKTTRKALCRDSRGNAGPLGTTLHLLAGMA
jgi:hypothetical protein